MSSNNAKITRRQAVTLLTLGTAGMLTACGKEPSNITEILNATLQANSGISKSNLAVHIDKTFTGKIRANMEGSLTYESDVTNRLEQAFRDSIRTACMQVISYTRAEVGKVEVTGQAGDNTISTLDFNDGKPLNLLDAKDL